MLYFWKSMLALFALYSENILVVLFSFKTQNEEEEEVRKAERANQTPFSRPASTLFPPA